MRYILGYAISIFGSVATYAICIKAILSWFVAAMPQPLGKIYYYLGIFTEPLEAPFRKLLRRFSSGIGLDFSPILAIMAIQFVCRLLSYLIIAL